MSGSTKLDPTTLASFAGAAAGHEGVLSDASGDLVIKPCTEAEVTFYETANAQHPEFAVFMPSYMGTLRLSEHVTMPTPAVAAASLTGKVKAIPLPSTTHSPSVAVPGTAASLAPTDPGPLKGKKLETDLHIVLENVSAGFKRPNILDLKLGARLWDEDAKPEKRARLDKVSSETTSGSLGFRIAGMRVWQGQAQKESGPVEQLEDVVKQAEASESSKAQHWVLDETTNHKNFNKFYGRQFSAETVLDGFKEYFLIPAAGVDEGQASIVIESFLADLREIQTVLESMESRMYSASLLFVYEGDPDAFQLALDTLSDLPEPKQTDDDEDNGEEDDEGEKELPKTHAVKLIDFAHAHFQPGFGPDENMLRGVKSTVAILEKLLKEVSA